jgi:hypothetical protein
MPPLSQGGIRELIVTGKIDMKTQAWIRKADTQAIVDAVRDGSIDQNGHLGWAANMRVQMLSGISLPELLDNAPVSDKCPF